MNFARTPRPLRVRPMVQSIAGATEKLTEEIRNACGSSCSTVAGLRANIAMKQLCLPQQLRVP